MTFDIHRDLFPSGDLDEDAADEYEFELCRLFAASPEAAVLPGVGPWLGLMLHYAFEYFDVTPATMDDAHLEQIVFDLFPRKVSCAPESAGEVVRELAAFFSFARREFGLANAEGCLALLDDAGAARLARELADPSNYGMAKSFVMSGHVAGSDMTSEKGLAAWQRTFNRNLVAHHVARRPVDPQEAAKDRNRRKRDRKRLRKR